MSAPCPDNVREGTYSEGLTVICGMPFLFDRINWYNCKRPLARLYVFGIFLRARTCHASAQSGPGRAKFAGLHGALPRLLEELQVIRVRPPYNGPKILFTGRRSGDPSRLLYTNACYSKPFHPSPRHLRMSIHTPIERPTSLLPLFTFPSCLDGDGIITQQPHTPRLQIVHQ